CVVPELSTRWPVPSTVDGVAVPVMRSIADRTSDTARVLPAPTPIVTLPLELVGTDVCAVEKLMVLPSTVKDDPFAGVGASVSELVAGTSWVEAVIAPAGVRLLLTAEPVTVLLFGLPSRLLAVAPGMIADV